MNEFSLLALVEAGAVKEDDDTLGVMQGVSLEHARSIAEWLVLATGKPVKLRYMSFDGVEYLEPTPESVQAKLAAARAKAQAQNRA